jgi:hypothetical protein
MVDDEAGAAAAGTRARRAAALWAGREDRVGDVEDGAALATRLEQRPPRALDDPEALEPVSAVNVEGPERPPERPVQGVDGHAPPIIWPP